MATSSSAIKRAVPEEIQKRLDDWNKLWRYSTAIYYTVGGLSVASSAVAAAAGGEVAKYLSAAAAVLTAIIGFVQPERRYYKFARAWRVLDSATLRYKAGLLEEAELYNALDRGEQLITEFESRNEGVGNNVQG